ncbi:hypothetical protein BD324DRAFT_653366 [Kockovaella imperatae]|uniref:Uncharacterized protein n=1 Tax=Kockovaella imperatae TaxID=4999 RepID=A0A1Y1UAR7_9TREE|nr:hypothetical protein BD324DRAFT_653366 [Kockovaella imperatae]ORX34596.1 hypothetical protein BD324DRAFT_653366 [Kockovaella imperatae]
MDKTSYPPQPSIESTYVAMQPTKQATMNAAKPSDGVSKQSEETLRLRGGCPGAFGSEQTGEDPPCCWCGWA